MKDVNYEQMIGPCECDLGVSQKEDALGAARMYSRDSRGSSDV